MDAAVRAARTLRAALSSSAPFDPDRLDGRDAGLIGDLVPVTDLLMRRYFHLRTRGVDAIPDGPVLYVANHNGGIFGPDLGCTLGTLWARRGPEAPLYALAHDFAMRQLTPVGRALQKLGAMRACPENALRALAAGAQVLVYPGGDVDAYRHFRRRDEVVFAERTGFVRVARRAGVPIVPIVVHGAHRSAIIFTEGEAIARRLGMARWARLERFPIALALPWIVAPGPWLPYAPLPLPLRLSVLPPIDTADDPDDSAVRERVRTAMQAELDVLAREARE